MDAVSGEIQREGRSEREWSRARGLRSTTTQSARGFLRGVQRLVVVAPHPDDEVLGVGGLIRLAHHFGVPVQLILATDGEASHAGSRSISRAQLRVQRVRESEAAFELLGGRREHIDRLQFADGELARREDELVNAIAQRLAANDLVVTTWLRDGHTDHEACGRAVRRAAQRLPCRHAFFPVWFWNWAAPDASDLPLAQVVRVPLTSRVRVAKRSALSLFQTQRTLDPDVPQTPILSDATLAYFARGFETLICA